jgi:nicotinate-nucleotide pyrophosphorylase (carboxylating)
MGQYWDAGDRFTDKLIDLALEEDLSAAGDVTTRALVPSGAPGAAELWAKEPMVLSGLEVFARVFERVDSSVKVMLDARNGQKTAARQKVAALSGPLSSLLIGERTALNILQRLCGTATLAAKAVEAVATVRGSKLKVLDTRKTAPGMRGLSKSAVRHGGAMNHRFGLFDGVLIKDNHIAAVGGSIPEAIERARRAAPRLVKLEVEVTTLDQLRLAIEHGAHVVMLDNMSDPLIEKAVALAKGRVELEVSGNVSIERLPDLARLGVDYVSMGALTHSARAMDLSLEILTSAPRKGRARRHG